MTAWWRSYVAGWRGFTVWALRNAADVLEPSSGSTYSFDADEADERLNGCPAADAA